MEILFPLFEKLKSWVHQNQFLRWGKNRTHNRKKIIIWATTEPREYIPLRSKVDEDAVAVLQAHHAKKEAAQKVGTVAAEPISGMRGKNQNPQYKKKVIIWVSTEPREFILIIEKL